MSFSSYTPPPPGTQSPTASTNYPYGPYHPSPSAPFAHPQTPGAYPYQAPNPYAWPFQYNYVPHPQSPAAPPPRPALPTPASTAARSPISNPPPAPQRSATFSYTPSQLRESVAAASTGGLTGRGSRKQSSTKGLFTKELRNIMYGFGDDMNPANDTVNVMEEILVEYLVDVCQMAGAPGRRTRLSIEDLRRVLSRPADAKKLARMEELLFMQEDIKRARAQFEDEIPGS